MPPLTCDKCGKPLVVKWDKRGTSLVCTGYPACIYTRELPVEMPEIEKGDKTEQTEECCQNCGRPMLLRKGRFGTFFACAGYPDCKTIKGNGGAQRRMS